MKKLLLQNPSYHLLQAGFKEWLQVMGFAQSSVKGMPYLIKEFLVYLEQREIKNIVEVEPELVSTYLNELSNRLAHGQSKCISVNYHNKHLQVLKRFSTYLRETDKGGFAVSEKAERAVKNPHAVLTPDEIQSLYNSTGNDAYGIRDKAILDLYYGAGLRRNEGVQLDVEDILFEHGLIYVRKGKNYTERYVPVNPKILRDLSDYNQSARQWFKCNAREQDAFLISLKGNRLDGMSALLRVKALQKNCDSASLKNKTIGLHSLRHSIATHLLHSGMPLQKIAQFLGHKTIESTQIYTHLVHENI